MTRSQFGLIGLLRIGELVSIYIDNTLGQFNAWPGLCPSHWQRFTQGIQTTTTKIALVTTPTLQSPLGKEFVAHGQGSIFLLLSRYLRTLAPRELNCFFRKLLAAYLNRFDLSHNVSKVQSKVTIHEVLHICAAPTKHLVLKMRSVRNAWMAIVMWRYPPECWNNAHNSTRWISHIFS